MQPAASSNWNTPYSGDIPHHYLLLPPKPTLTFYFGFSAPGLWHGSVPRATRAVHPLMPHLCCWAEEWAFDRLPAHKSEDKPTLYATKTQQKPSCELRASTRSLRWAGGLFVCDSAEKPLRSPLDPSCPHHVLANECISVAPRAAVVCLSVCLSAGWGCWRQGSITCSQQAPVQPSSCRALKGTGHCRRTSWAACSVTPAVPGSHSPVPWGAPQIHLLTSWMQRLGNPLAAGSVHITKLAGR